MVHLLRGDPDDIVSQVLEATVRIPHAEIVIQKIFSKIYRCLHETIISDNLGMGIKK